LFTEVIINCHDTGFYTSGLRFIVPMPTPNRANRQSFYRMKAAPVP
jgi:hypothetical protein